MPQWSIKLSLTTSARYVNLTCFSSRKAHWLSAGVFSLALWALVYTSLPLVTLFPLFTILLQRYQNRDILYPQLLGHLSLSFSGRLKLGQRQWQLAWVNSQFYWWFISLKTTSGERFLIWRDSCQEDEYRQLLVVIKQLQMKRELT
ncbi:protein YgfX [Vibrio navarrensis]|uniref:protein YgfX n=1 Tax=Vibrio navarrensis TaxID=29495 RepID=UPI0030842ADE